MLFTFLTATVCQHAFADDTETQKSTSLDQHDPLRPILALKECVSDGKSWMTFNRLQLNDGKTEAILVMFENPSTSVYKPRSVSTGNADVDFF